MKKAVLTFMIALGALCAATPARAAKVTPSSVCLQTYQNHVLNMSDQIDNPVALEVARAQCRKTKTLLAADCVVIVYEANRSYVTQPDLEPVVTSCNRIKSRVAIDRFRIDYVPRNGSLPDIDATVTSALKFNI